MEHVRRFSCLCGAGPPHGRAVVLIALEAFLNLKNLLRSPHAFDDTRAGQDVGYGPEHCHNRALRRIPLHGRSCASERIS